MASIKVKYRPSTIADHEGAIYYQIIHERKVRQLNTEYHVMPDEWDENRSMVTTKQSSERKSFILSIRERIRWDVERLTKIDKRLDAEGLSYTADDVIDEFRRYASEYSLFNFMESLIIKFKQHGKTRTSETYTAALNSFKKFREDEDIMLDCMTSEIMEAYEAWHKQRGNSPNTISFYTRILRAVYHRAVEDDIIENRNPFRHVYTGVDKTIKRALPLPSIKKIKALDLSLSPPLDYARDMFLMSFYLRGMSFIDMAYLKKTDLKKRINCLSPSQDRTAAHNRMGAGNASHPRQISRQSYAIFVTHHQDRWYQRAMCLPQHRLQHQSQLEEDSRLGQNKHPLDDVRCSPLMGQCRKSKGHPPQRNQRRHGPRQRSHYPIYLASLRHLSR